MIIAGNVIDLYAILGKDDMGDFGITAIQLDDTVIPCVTKRHDLLDKMIGIITQGRRHEDYYIVKFTSGELLEVIKP